jgi:signal transduction histidine kinase
MTNEELKIQFFDQADVLFQIYDEHLNCIEVNDATLTLFKLDRNQYLGKNIAELNPSTVESGRYQAYLNVVATGKTLVIEDVKNTVNNQDIYFRVKAFKVGTGLGMVTKNITDLEMAIKKANAQLEQKLKHLDEANKNISEMMKLVTHQNTQLNDFCGIISHNLRAPLVNLSILSDFIDDCQELEKREIMISKIKPVVATLNETFNNLVESLQIRGDLQVELEVIDFESLTQKLLEKHKIEIDLLNVSISIDFSEAQKIRYSRTYLDSILSNLISNAIKYRNQTRPLKISISTEKKGTIIVLKVTDNGLGIDLKTHGHHMFKMRKTFHEHPDAKGYGLFLTKTQVEAMGGTISAKSAPDKGTTFEIEFTSKNNAL